MANPEKEDLVKTIKKSSKAKAVTKVAETKETKAEGKGKKGTKGKKGKDPKLKKAAAMDDGVSQHSSARTKLKVDASKKSGLAKKSKDRESSRFKSKHDESDGDDAIEDVQGEIESSHGKSPELD